MSGHGRPVVSGLLGVAWRIRTAMRRPATAVAHIPSKGVVETCHPFVQLPVDYYTRNVTKYVSGGREGKIVQLRYINHTTIPLRKGDGAFLLWGELSRISRPMSFKRRFGIVPAHSLLCLRSIVTAPTLRRLIADPFYVLT